MGEVSDIGHLLQLHDASQEQRLERVAKRSGWAHSALVAVAGVVVWAFTAGVAWANLVTKSELAKDHAEVMAALELLKGELHTHSERITSLETEMRVRNAATAEPAPIAVKGKK